MVDTIKDTIQPRKGVLYSTNGISFVAESVELADGDTFTQIVDSIPNNISIAVFPGAGAAMNVFYTVSEEFSTEFFEWPPGAVTVKKSDLLLGHAYSIKITCTGGTGKYYIGT